MSLVYKIVLLIILSLIAHGDFKERLVWNVYFLVFGFLGCILFFQNSFFEYFKVSVVTNLTMILGVFLSLFLISKFYLKKNFLKEVIGLGDLLFFIAFAISFPTLSFITFFVFSILFTLVLSLVLKITDASKRFVIPLAGSMSLFLIAVYLIHWLGWYENIYVV